MLQLMLARTGLRKVSQMLHSKSGVVFKLQTFRLPERLIAYRGEGGWRGKMCPPEECSQYVSTVFATGADVARSGSVFKKHAPWRQCF